MQWLVWLAFVVLCNGAGFLSSLAGTDASLYQRLAQPSWAPPSWLFAPVWISLYTLMATATFLVWRQCRGTARRNAMIVFAVQLALNVMWTPVFFGLHRYGLAVVVIALVLVSVTAMLVVYARHVRGAGLMLVPLWLWVAFATALNASIWLLNR
jgi:tryptophan-rich sensory protein